MLNFPFVQLNWSAVKGEVLVATGMTWGRPLMSRVLCHKNTGSYFPLKDTNCGRISSYPEFAICFSTKFNVASMKRMPRAA